MLWKIICTHVNFWNVSYEKYWLDKCPNYTRYAVIFRHVWYCTKLIMQESYFDTGYAVKRWFLQVSKFPKFSVHMSALTRVIIYKVKGSRDIFVHLLHCTKLSRHLSDFDTWQYRNDSYMCQFFMGVILPEFVHVSICDTYHMVPFFIVHAAKLTHIVLYQFWLYTYRRQHVS